MVQEEKELLLKDLCARLPYGVIINIPHLYNNGFKANIKAINPEREIVYYEICGSSSPLFDRNILGIKPYLRPMSSMTEEEHKEAKTNGCIIYHDTSPKNRGLMVTASPKGFDWLNKKMFDYRGLIAKGLALEAPEGVYNTMEII